MSTFLDNLKSSWSMIKAENPKENPSEKTCEGESKPADVSNKPTNSEIQQQETGVEKSQIASRMFGMALKASTKLQEKATNISSIVSERTIIWNIEKERQKFIGELQKERKFDDQIGLGELIGNAEAQKHIVSISANAKNFTEDPPLTANIETGEFVVKSFANNLFSLDPRLKTIRFELVPKQVSEEKFWRNYAYRISLIKKFMDENPTENQKELRTANDESVSSVEENVIGIGDKKAKKEELLTTDDTKVEDDEEQLLNDLEEFEVVSDGNGNKNGEKVDEELDKEINALLEN